ncbi:MAG: hypothetical protein M3Z22_08420 [Verrucomicrobiota bacterium]|nr:hypothetical protein [Verrucomicrobiota bacterium]
MRIFVAAVCLLTLTSGAHAQQQERKLLDRLLKPDTSLQNGAQGKTFTPREAIVTKTSGTKSFFVRRRFREKEFAATRELRLNQLMTNNAALPPRSQSFVSKHVAASTKTFATSEFETRSLPGAEQKVPTSDYPDAKPFLARGKSQKALSAQDRPLTIDEVRELLNKNK